MDIKVYGPSSSSYRMVVSVLNRFLKKAKIPFDLKEINDVSVLLSRQVASVPAIQKDREPIVGLHSNGSFYSSLRMTLNQILKSENYGDMSKFVIPIDFSDSSINALVYGHRLATDTGAVTKAIHVFDGCEDSTESIKVNKRLDKIVDAINNDWGSDLLKASFISSEIRYGNPVEKILHSIEDNAGELVVVGTKSEGKNDIKWFGSIASELITLSPCPILLVPEKAHYRGFRKILFAVNQWIIDSQYIDTLARICLPLKAEIHCVHICNKATKVKPRIPSLDEQYPQELITYSYIFNIDVTRGLQNYAHSNDIEVVAVIPNTKTIFKHFMNNSTSRELASLNDFPILVIK